MFYFFFYLPLGLDVRCVRAAWMTWSLAALAVLGFLGSRLDPTWFWAHSTNFVFVPAAPTAWALVASAFMHGDWLHLLSNLLALGVFGPALEARLGSWRLAALFLFCHVAGNLVQGAMALALVPETAGYGVLGASGAVAGLVGVALVRLHFARLRVGFWAFMPLQAYTKAGTQSLPVQAAVLIWFLVQLALALAQTQGGETGIAVGAHLGGLSTGIGLALLFGLRHAAMAEALLERGRRHLAAARWYPAQGEFLEYVRRCPDDAAGHLELARTFRLTGRERDADEHYRRACARFAALRRIDRVEEVYAEAERGNADFVLAPELQLQLAGMLERCCKHAAAERVYRQYARLHGSARGAPFALFRTARLLQARNDTAGARAVYAQLLAEHAATPEADHARLALAAAGPSARARRRAA